MCILKKLFKRRKKEEKKSEQESWYNDSQEKENDFVEALGKYGNTNGNVYDMGVVMGVSLK